MWTDLSALSTFVGFLGRSLALKRRHHKDPNPRHADRYSGCPQRRYRKAEVPALQRSKVHAIIMPEEGLEPPTGGL